MTKFESPVKVIPFSQERVYGKLSDLSNLEAIKDRLPEDKVKDISFDSDSLSFTVSPVGQLTLSVNLISALNLKRLIHLFHLICGFSLLQLGMKNVN